MNNPIFYNFQSVQNIRVDVCISRKIHFQQRLVFYFGAERLREILLSPDPIIFPILDYNISFNVHIIASTKLRFQNIIRDLLGPHRLAEINASVNPFILPLIRYDLGLDVFIFVLY